MVSFMVRMCDWTVTQAFQFSSDGIHSLMATTKRKSYSLATQHNPLYYAHLYRLLEKCSIFGMALLRIKPAQTSPHYSKTESRPYAAGQEARAGEAQGRERVREQESRSSVGMSWLWTPFQDTDRTVWANKWSYIRPLFALSWCSLSFVAPDLCVFYAIITSLPAIRTTSML